MRLCISIFRFVSVRPSSVPLSSVTLSKIGRTRRNRGRISLDMRQFKQGYVAEGRKPTLALGANTFPMCQEGFWMMVFEKIDAKALPV